MGAIEETLAEIRAIVNGGELASISSETSSFPFCVIWNPGTVKGVIVELSAEQWLALRREFDERAEELRRQYAERMARQARTKWKQAPESPLSAGESETVLREERQQAKRQPHPEDKETPAETIRRISGVNVPSGHDLAMKARQWEEDAKRRKGEA